MKLSNMSIIFIIIVLPIILMLSYYISLQIDTINMQTAYTAKQLDATKEAIEAFEINTVEWNESYSTNNDSKRRDIMASINTFTTSFANSVGVGGTNKENILTYIPAIAFTLYDGYYIYTPSEIKQVIKDNNGIAVFVTKELATTGNPPAIQFNTGYKDEYKGQLLYEYDSDKGGTSDGTYNGKNFTLKPEYAKSTYEHILKPYSTYSARYKNGDTDITVNYTLDNYITIYGNVNRKYVVKSGYLIAPQDGLESAKEWLTEKIAWRRNEDDLYTCKEYNYVYAEDNTKVYFDRNTTFQVSSTGIRTDLDKTTGVKYKKIRNSSGTVIYQALNNGTFEGRDELGNINIIEIVQGNLYSDKKGTEVTITDEEIKITYDYSARNYYIESRVFTKWVQQNLADITIGDMKDVQDKSIYGELGTEIFLCADPENEDSAINLHKREVIKQTIISNLNQAITSYSRNSQGEYVLPILTETDWEHIFRNVSIITFLQNIPIGMKHYNNYTIATSTSNKEYVNPDEMYFINSTPDVYYHLPYCSEFPSYGSTYITGYRNTDFTVKSYENEGEINYYYKHPSKNQACYYCIVQRDLYEKLKGNEPLENMIEYYKNVAIARERYRNLSEINLKEELKLEIVVSFLSEGELVAERRIAYPGKYGDYGELPVPTKSGHTFLGWYTRPENGAGTQVTEETEVIGTENHELYAHWAVNTYTVTFYANGGTPESQDRNIQYGYNYWLYLPQTPTMKGHKFAGWYTASPGGEPITDKTVMEREENHNIYAQWSANLYTVTLDANGGTLTGHDQIRTYYSNIYGNTLRSEPIRDGHTFDGWYTEREGGTKITAETKMEIDGNHTLYAHWTPQTYTITYDANGGSDVPSAQTKFYGQDLTLSSKVPIREGYIFGGWATNSSATTPQYQPGGTYTENNNITLYAVWKDIPVTSVTISPSTQWIPIGSTLQLEAIVYPNNATDKSVKWSITNSAVATVEDGKVTATGAGSTTILVRAGGKIDTLSICIYNATVAANTTIPIYKYELGANSEYRYVSSTRTLTASASEEAKLIVAPAIFDSNYMQLNTGINYKYTNGYGDIYLRKDDIHLITDS